jgi:hypothetical protein
MTERRVIVQHVHARRALPARRLTITHSVLWRDRTYLIGVGFDREGRAQEAFVDGLKQGTELEALLDDACVLLSVLLQLGYAAKQIAHHLGREGTDPADPETGKTAPYASPIGMIAERIAAIEAENATGIREAHTGEPEEAAP